MDERSPSAARAEALRAYERGRALHAAQTALWMLPIGFVAYGLGAHPLTAALTALFLYALAAIGGWWRSDIARGALSGGAVIAIPAALSVLMKTLGPSMSPGQCTVLCLYGACGLGGIAGYLIGQTAGRRSRDHGLGFGAAAVVAASFSMTVGCTALGFGSLAGLTMGLVSIGLPTFLWSRVTT